jgi:hypothetical protein
VDLSNTRLGTEGLEHLLSAFRNTSITALRVPEGQVNLSLTQPFLDDEQDDVCKESMIALASRYHAAPTWIV